MKRFLQNLRSPHPLGFGWAYALVPAGAVFFILVGLAPYGFAEVPLGARILKALPFATITAMAAPLSLWLAKLLVPGWMTEANWTVGREIVYNVYDVAMIGLLNTLYLYFAYRPQESFIDTLARLESHTFVVGILPVLALIALKHQKALRQQLELAKSLNEELRAHPLSMQVSATVRLLDEKGAFEIQLLPQHILYLKADGNYVDVVFQEKPGTTMKKIIRNRLKQLYDFLPSEGFYQCHKSYIVNIQHIIRFEGNARDLKLIMAGDAIIPVARTRSTTLLTVLRGPDQS